MSSNLSPEQFAELAAQGYNRIPVHREVLADLETPVTAYLKLARGKYSYLFESVQGGEKWGRYSIIGLNAHTVIKVFADSVRLEKNGELLEQHTLPDPLVFVAEYQSRFKVPELEGLPMFTGGLVGYFSYDTVRYVEKKLRDSAPEDVLGTPDILLMLSDEVLVFDNLQGTMHLVVHADPSQPEAFADANARLDQLVSALPSAIPDLPPMNVAPAADASAKASDLAENAFESSFGEHAFKQAVETIKEYVLAGDCMQVVISQRLSIPFGAEPFNLYRALRRLNPSPYMYFLDLDDFYIVGSSPEILARAEQGEVTVRPIAGTRRRGHNEAEDLELEQDLLNDPKEIAEHLMLIDLGRNDVGRVAKTGTVEVSDKMIVERYSHVMHIVSSVKGQLQDQMNSLDVLKASLPAGTLSGAPKVRAMEIIDELEPVKRGIYGGAVGYLSFQGDMDTAIAIRTAVIKDEMLYVQAGAGIVADSVPRLEWKETMNKARAIFRAVDMVSNTAKEERS